MAQNESVETTINSRVMSKTDTAENWEANNPKLLKGEVVPVVVTDSEGNITNVAFKVGDGVSNYATLPFASANAWDVFDWAKAESVEIRITDDSKYYIDFFDVGSTSDEKTIVKSVELFTVDQTYSENSKNAQSGKAISDALSSKVDKVTGKALSTNDFTTTLLNKLNGIAEGANKYVHPSHTAYATAGLYKITVDALGHITSAAAVTKEDITKLGIPAITVDDTLSTTSTNPIQNKTVASALTDKQDLFADLNYVWNSNDSSVNQLSLVLKSASKTTSTGGVVSLIPELSLTNEAGQGVKLTGISAPTADNGAVNKKYVDDKVKAIVVDDAMSDTSTNPVQNKVVKAEIDSKALNVTDTGSGNLSISSLGYSPVTTNSVYISDFTDADAASVNVSDNAVSTQSTGSDSINTMATADADSNITLKSIYFKDLDATYRIPDAVTVDTALSSSSKNPVQNQVINTALAGKTDLSASGASSLINKLSIGSDAPSDADYFVSQYAGGGTTNTNYYRRPVSALNTYIKSKADKTPTSGSANLITSGAVYTALSGKASATHTHTLNQVTSSTFNTTGSVDYISRSLVPYISGTKFYGMPAAAITVEYSRDGGATWIDYGLTDAQKMLIFDHSKNIGLYLGKATTKADNSINNMLRITIDAAKSDGRYLSTDSMFTWMSSNGNTTCVTLEVASYNAPTTFRTIVNNAPIGGWSGPNISHYGTIAFGGSTAGSTSPNNQIYRLTYKQTAINSNYSSAVIADIRFFGSAIWGNGSGVVNSMLVQGTPYRVTVNSDGATGTVKFNLLGAAFGSDTSVGGKYSLAGGVKSVVNHEGSVAYGSNLNTSAQYQAIFGKYNKTNASALLQVGNGTSTSATSNAFEVYTDGHAEVKAQGTTDNSVVIKSTLTSAIGTTSYSSADGELYLPTGSNMVIPNTLVGRIFIGPDADTPNSPDFKIYVNDTIDDGKLIITSLKTPSNDEDAANKKYVDDAISTKQDKFATVTDADSTQTVTIGDTLKITTNPNLLADQIISTKALYIQGSSTSGVRLGKTVLEGSADFDATAGYLRVGDNPLADDFAVNKKYVTTAVSNKLDADTDNYNITYDTTSEAIKITFKN